MTAMLVRKLLRDVRVGLIVVALLLAAFQCLWIKVVERLSGHLLPLLGQLAAACSLTNLDIEKEIFSGPGRIS